MRYSQGVSPASTAAISSITASSPWSSLILPTLTESTSPTRTQFPKLTEQIPAGRVTVRSATQGFDFDVRLDLTENEKEAALEARTASFPEKTARSGRGCAAMKDSDRLILAELYKDPNLTKGAKAALHDAAVADEADSPYRRRVRRDCRGAQGGEGCASRLRGRMNAPARARHHRRFVVHVQHIRPRRADDGGAAAAPQDALQRRHRGQRPASSAAWWTAPWTWRLSAAAATARSTKSSPARTAPASARARRR